MGGAEDKRKFVKKVNCFNFVLEIPISHIGSNTRH